MPASLTRRAALDSFPCSGAPGGSVMLVHVCNRGGREGLRVFMCVCVHVRVHPCACVRPCVCMGVFMCEEEGLCASVRTWVSVCVSACVRPCECVCTCVSACTCAYLGLHAFACDHVCAFMCTHVWLCVRCTCLHVSAQPLPPCLPAAHGVNSLYRCLHC